MNTTPGLVRRAAIGVAGGIAVFFACAYALKGALAFAPEIPAALPQVLLKVMIVAVSVGAWATLRRPWRDMGWRRPERGSRVWPWYFVGAVPMGLATIGMILTGHRHPAVAGLSFPEIVLTIWIVSSVAEEIFVRGLIQSWIAAGSAAPDLAADRLVIVAASALVFACMHVPLMWKGAGVVGGGIIVAATFGVGWAAATVRAKSKSLWHAIAIHVVANMAAVPFGIIGVVIYRIVHHKMPAL